MPTWYAWLGPFILKRFDSFCTHPYYLFLILELNWTEFPWNTSKIPFFSSSWSRTIDHHKTSKYCKHFYDPGTFIEPIKRPSVNINHREIWFLHPLNREDRKWLNDQHLIDVNSKFYDNGDFLSFTFSLLCLEQFLWLSLGRLGIF